MAASLSRCGIMGLEFRKIGFLRFTTLGMASATSWNACESSMGKTSSCRTTASSAKGFPSALRFPNSSPPRGASLVPTVCHEESYLAPTLPGSSFLPPSQLPQMGEALGCFQDLAIVFFILGNNLGGTVLGLRVFAGEPTHLATPFLVR